MSSSPSVCLLGRRIGGVSSEVVFRHTFPAFRPVLASGGAYRELREVFLHTADAACPHTLEVILGVTLACDRVLLEGGLHLVATVTQFMHTLG